MNREPSRAADRRNQPHARAVVMTTLRLEFEKPIFVLEDALAELEAKGPSDGGEAIRRMRRELVILKRKIYGNLTAWQTILVARHQDRPQFVDYVDLDFRGFRRAARRPGHRRRPGHSHRLRPPGRFPRHAHRPHERADDAGTPLLLLRMRASGRVSQGAAAHEDGGQIPPADHLLDRHPRRVSRASAPRNADRRN